ncbi:MAG: KH domain-containing protein [Patescibacteria group bacterium]
MSEIDQQFIEYVVKSLVGNPDAVQIERRIDEKGVLLELTVDPEDLGRVIGKRGATAQSLRTLLRALGTKNDARYNLKIIDNGPLDHAGSSSSSDDNAQPADDATDAPAPAPEEEPVAEVPAEAPVEEPAAPVQPEEPAAPTEEDQASDRLRRTRAELADLDDLDV